MKALKNRDEFNQEARQAGLATTLNRSKVLLGSCLDPSVLAPHAAVELARAARASTAAIGGSRTVQARQKHFRECAARCVSAARGRGPRHCHSDLYRNGV